MVLKCFSCYGGEPKGKESPPSHHPSSHHSPRPSSYEEQQVSDESPRASDEEQQVSHEERQEESVVVNVEQPIVVIEDVAADIIHFPFEVILKATDAFQITNLLGRGGFGAVYAGKLSDGQDVAVKRVLGNIVHEKKSRDAFLAEMSILKLQRMRHPNIIRLIGYYVTHNEMILVLERMAEGSLSSNIYDLNPYDEGLNWSERLTVARGIANALEFLHSQDIVYRDLKPDNVLLSKEYSPKLTDFGFAVHLEDAVAYNMKNGPPGTYGYRDPACQKESKISSKSDVYSFGVVLLSLLTGREALDGDIDIVKWAQPLFNHDFHGAAKLAPVVQKVLGNGVEEVLHIAKQCVHEERDARPSMVEVVQRLSDL